MDRTRRLDSTRRGSFRLQLDASPSQNLFDGTRTAPPRRPVESPYQRYSYLGIDKHHSANTVTTLNQYPKENCCNCKENRMNGESERILSIDRATASRQESFKEVFASMVEPPKIETRDSRATSTRAEFLKDVSRCQDQVEELIEVFRLMATGKRTSPQPAPAAVRVDTPQLRERFKSKLPRKRTETTMTTKAQPGVLDLEQARANLEESLRDALHLLDKFPRERELIQRSVEPPDGDPLSHEELLEVVDCLEQISLYESAPTEDAESMYQQRQCLGDQPPSISHKDWNVADSYAPVLEECLNFSSDPCSTPSGCEDEMFWIHNQAEEALFKGQQCPSRESPDVFEHQACVNDSSRSPEFVLAQSKSRESSHPFRVFFQDPIYFGSLSRNSSQSLSGCQTSFAIRIETHLERDALSDSEERDTNEDSLPMCRRTHSAIAALCPVSCPQDVAHGRQRSLADSSDWDVVEDGISVRGPMGSLSPAFGTCCLDTHLEMDEAPGRLTPEVVPWSSVAFSTFEPPQSSRRDFTYSLSRDTGCSARASEQNSEACHTLSHDNRCTVDRSVQCDNSSQMHERTRQGLTGCGFLFKKKATNRKNRGLVSRMLLPISAPSRTAA